MKAFELKGANLELWRRWNSKTFCNHGEAFSGEKGQSRALEKAESKNLLQPW